MKSPHPLFPHIFAFPPHRKTLGGTAYFIQATTPKLQAETPEETEAKADPQAETSPKLQAETQTAAPLPVTTRTNTPAQLEASTQTDTQADTQTDTQIQAQLQASIQVSAQASNGSSNILVDCPPWNSETSDFLQKHGGVGWLFLTHRTAMAEVAVIRAALGCEVVVQEQEAYLLPNLPKWVFQREIRLGDRGLGLWTPGHSPGSACFYWAGDGGILFSGRHLLPTVEGKLAPLRTSKTFHWPRQCRSVQALVERFSPETLSYVCPGANVGFLRGKGKFDRAYGQLAAIAPPR